MAYNCSCNLKTPDIKLRNDLIKWLINIIPNDNLSQFFRFDTDHEGYYTLTCSLDLDEELRDIVFDYICKYQEESNNAIIGSISKHLCNHDVKGICGDITKIGGENDVF
jgi:hypothetical protein